MALIYPLSVYLKITQIYHANHLGVDFGWNDYPQGACNQPIIAAESGIVLDCADGYGNTYPSRRIYGNYVNISHDIKIGGKNVYTMYGHLLKGLTVKKGQRVRKGQVIGYMGNSGYSNGQHLHFELRIGSNAKANSIDPIEYLAIENEGLYVNPNSKEFERIKHRRTTVGTPVPRDTTKDQIEIVTSTLNARSEPKLSGSRLGYATMGIFNIYGETKSETDEYTWAEIESGVFVAEKEGVYTKKLPKETAASTFSVIFPYVSKGDKDYLLAVAKTLELDTVVNENKN